MVRIGTAGWVMPRLHGSPRMYYSAYEAEFLVGVARAVEELQEGMDTWVIFDNTAAGHAFGNAVELQRTVLADGPTARGAVTS